MLPPPIVSSRRMTYPAWLSPTRIMPKKILCCVGGVTRPFNQNLGAGRGGEGEGTGRVLAPPTALIPHLEVYIMGAHTRGVM